MLSWYGKRKSVVTKSTNWFVISLGSDFHNYFLIFKFDYFLVLKIYVCFFLKCMYVCLCTLRSATWNNIRLLWCCNKVHNIWSCSTISIIEPIISDPRQWPSGLMPRTSLNEWKGTHVRRKGKSNPSVQITIVMVSFASW